MNEPGSRTLKHKRASKCTLCSETTGLHRHHIKPRSLGGSDDPDNVITLCERHHEAVHDLDDECSISSLTKAALAKKKAAGILLGNRTNLKEASIKGAAAAKAKADAFALRLRPMINQLQKTGMSFRCIATTLNIACVPTARSGAWNAGTVSRIIKRSTLACI